MTHTTPRFACMLLALLGAGALTGCGAFPGLEIRVGGERPDYEQPPQRQAPPPYANYPQPPPPGYGYPPPQPTTTVGVPCDHPVPPPPVSPPMPTMSTVAYLH